MDVFFQKVISYQVLTRQIWLSVIIQTKTWLLLLRPLKKNKSTYCIMKIHLKRLHINANVSVIFDPFLS